MNRKKISKLRGEIESLKGRGGIKSREVESIARSIGRKQHPRGSEPTWIFDEFPDRRPLSIPNHTTDLNRFTARSILNHLEEDLDYLESIHRGGEEESQNDEGE